MLSERQSTSTFLFNMKSHDLIVRDPSCANRAWSKSKTLGIRDGALLQISLKFSFFLIIKEMPYPFQYFCIRLLLLLLIHYMIIIPLLAPSQQ